MARSARSGSRRSPNQAKRRPTFEALESRLTPTSLPPSFTDTRVFTGLDSPTAMDFAPDGRLFVLEQSGDVQYVRANGTSWQALHLSNVDSSGERGLLGIAFDPNFSVNHYAYLYYTNVLPSPAPWAAGEHNQISRFTVDDTNPNQPVFTNEAPILDIATLSAFTNHNGGAIHFGLDGMLYANTGDNVQNVNINGQSYRASQSLGNLLGKQLRINVAAFNSGLAVRDDTIVGHLIPSNNPFVRQTTGINQLIFALGFRNPYTFAVQPGTGVIYVNDVGENTWEEINQVVAGANYGWSGGNTDGFGQTPPGPGVYRDPVLAYNHSGGPAGGGAAIVGGTFYNPAGVQFPSSYVGKYFYADLGGDWIRVFNPAFPGSSINPDPSQPFASGTVDGIRDLKVDAAGNLFYLAGGAGGVVDRISYTTSGLAPLITGQPLGQSVVVGRTATLTVTATGSSLSYQWQHFVNNAWINVGTSTPNLVIPNAQPADAGSYRVSVSNPFGVVFSQPAALAVVPPPTPPRISVAPVSTVAPLGGTATFSVAATGTAPLAYLWQHLVGATWVNVGTSLPRLTLSPLTQADAGAYRVFVGNAGGAVVSNPFTLTVDAVPLPRIILPTAGARYNYNQTIPFAGSAVDPEDGVIPTSRLFWIVQFIHTDNAAGAGLRVSNVYTISSVAAGAFPTGMIDPSPFQWYRVVLGAIDSKGVVGTTFVDVTPNLAQFTVASNPTGIRLLVDGVSVASGTTFTSVVGMPHAIGALSPVRRNGRSYNFASWSDGGPAVHAIATPATRTTYTALYTPAPAAAAVSAKRRG